MENERDFSAEVAELIAERPELAGGELPEEVTQACLDGRRLKDAFDRYAGERAEREEILRQNELSGARAPVGGVSGGGAAPSREADDFLRGLYEEY